MKDAMGHGSNGKGGAAAANTGKVYHRGAMRDANNLSGTNAKNAIAADDKAARVMASIDNGAHSGAINALPALQRRHYENIAATLKAQGVGVDADKHAERVANYASRLSMTNPQFNRGRFIKASTP